MTELPSMLFLLMTITFFAAFEQTITGFGFSLIVMPLATWLFGLKTAAPLIALTGLTLYTINLIRNRQAINSGEALRLGIAAIFGVPVGVWGLSNLNESMIKLALGIILIGFAIYSALNVRWSMIISSRWAWLVGFLTGCLGGAYNTPGPPLIIYGSLREWQRVEFRGVLQALFFTTGILTTLSHWFARNLTPNVLTLYVYAAPALILGLIAGAFADRFINHRAFRIIVIAMVFVLGVSMVLGIR